MADKSKDSIVPRIEDHDDSEVEIIPGAKEPSREVEIPEDLPILAVRNLVLFPGTVAPLQIGRAKSLKLLEDVLPDQKIIATVCQRHPQTEEPTPDDLYGVGTAVMVLKLLKTEEGGVSIIVHGLSRVKIEKFWQQNPYMRGKIAELVDKEEQDKETDALMNNVRTIAGRIIELSPSIPDEAIIVLSQISHPGQLADFLASNIEISISGKQQLLEELSVNKRLRHISTELQKQFELLELSSKIQQQVQSNIDQSQREYFLQEQMKAIQKELGQFDEKTAEVDELREKIKQAGMIDVVKDEAARELGRMEKIPTTSPEYHVVRTYLDIMTELPWSKSSEDKLDVNLAREILDTDHYNLEKVKRRILEYLAVRKLAPASRGPILCFVGPPGVGKTSLGKSIARAMGRKFIRMSLGGMRDEAELRGHRRTYIGAMPGRVIQEIRKAGTNNPVFMLDELDKVGADFRGDPTSALLEILDPAQNNSFQDHYLNVPFDLSKVMFIATANYMAPVPPALADRMEVIEIPGYTAVDKLHIAMKYLIGRQLTENGLTEKRAKWTEPAVQTLIESYTREAGVRELERQIGTVCRSIAALIATGKARSRTIKPKLVAEILGPRKYESELALRTSMPGVATGLAFTPVGGEIIFIEAISYPGKGALTLTGQIGDVMKESAQAALGLIKSRATELGLNVDDFSKIDIHIHVPAGAIPKDGPSAGVAMYTALCSLMTGRHVRPEVAMTGEVTLRGLVLPVGGIKEKVLGARRAGIKTVILPRRNRKDLIDIPDDIREELEFHFADNVDQVLAKAFSTS